MNNHFKPGCKVRRKQEFQSLEWLTHYPSIYNDILVVIDVEHSSIIIDFSGKRWDYDKFDLVNNLPEWY